MKKIKFLVLKKNDIYRFSGYVMIIYGQTQAKDIAFDQYGFSGHTNIITLVGVFLAALFPFVTRYLESKGK